MRSLATSDPVSDLIEQANMGKRNVERTLILAGMAGSIIESLMNGSWKSGRTGIIYGEGKIDQLDRTIPKRTDGGYYYGGGDSDPYFSGFKIPLEETGEGVGGAGSGNPKRDQLLNSVQNDKLKNAVNEIYRSGATTGDGGLAGAVRHELSTGQLVGGKSHITKATERITNLENIINKQNLSPSDLNIAKSLLEDLRNALGGR